MKFASFLTLASFAVSAALAQTIEIGEPQPCTPITPGQNFTVQVNRPDSLVSSVDVAIVISLLPCPENGVCPSPFDELGSTLYLGPYNPQFPTAPGPNHIPQQNFSVQVPPSFQAGYKAQLAVAHLALVS
ncbi:hypothetical protein EI94DRAFT_1742468, partial [Lactarius quietus]